MQTSNTVCNCTKVTRACIGTRTVNVTDSKGGTWPDEDWFAVNAPHRRRGARRLRRRAHDPARAEIGSRICTRSSEV
ncbi:hypothetical protein GCM10022251_35170 [Phytohabitans flavus]|uniref:Uncharacterized protein n=1 Tax=Phytohabitans flavus TaxID=1076124 RepID=A0A6F8XMU8_9ACTN|nr:hypothetical protein Pflav_015290 [Phytohabitans flavus]